MPTDTSEKGLESLIVAALTGAGSQKPPVGTPTGEQPGGYDNLWYVQGDPKDYDREHAVDLAKLLDFLKTTQPDAFEALGLGEDGPRRESFLHRLQGEIAKRGVVEILRRGVQHGPHGVSLFYGTPSPGNAKAKALNRSNLFSVTRQLKYSRNESQLALDLGLFINGLPVARTPGSNTTRPCSASWGASLPTTPSCSSSSRTTRPSRGGSKTPSSP